MDEQKLDSPIEDVKIDPLRATELMGVAGFNVDMLTNPQDSLKMQEVLRYFSDKEDAEHVLNKFKIQTRGEGMLDHAFRFVRLRQQRDGLSAELQKVDNELSLYD